MDALKLQSSSSPFDTRSQQHNGVHYPSSYVKGGTGEAAAVWDMVKCFVISSWNTWSLTYWKTNGFFSMLAESRKLCQRVTNEPDTRSRWKLFHISPVASSMKWTSYLGNSSVGMHPTNFLEKLSRPSLLSLSFIHCSSLVALAKAADA